MPLRKPKGPDMENVLLESSVRDALDALDADFARPTPALLHKLDDLQHTLVPGSCAQAYVRGLASAVAQLLPLLTQADLHRCC